MGQRARECVGGRVSVTDYEAYRRTQLKNGQEFQDFAADALYAAGYPVTTYSSKTYQLNVGESRGGWEFKYDMKYARSGNLWIEVAEKARPRAGDYAPSGIYARTNTKFYVIGNYDRIFVYDKKILLIFHKAGRYTVIENQTKTSKGFLFPDADARKYAIFILEPALSKVIQGSIQEIERHARELYRALRLDAESFNLELSLSGGAR